MLMITCIGEYSNTIVKKKEEAGWGRAIERRDWSENMNFFLRAGQAF